MNATITGYIVKYKDSSVNLRIEVAEAVRGFNVPCMVSFLYPENEYKVTLNGQELTVLNVEQLP